MSDEKRAQEAANGPPETPILDTIDSPADLRRVPEDQLEVLAQEIRKKIIHVASCNGGHLAPHLGVVELTLAVHYVFDTPNDHLVYDVGHQCYAHKLITGRRDLMDTIRKRRGLSGYPTRTESPWDAFGTGHSSTSISSALGMAVASARQGKDVNSIAIIGDGAMTAGMAFEALSHAGHLDANLIVILNDNNMSISPNVGALSAYFNRLITGGLYNRAKGDIKKIIPEHFHSAARRLEHSVKSLITPGTLFEELGFKYVGAVDGHCIHTLVECLDNIKDIGGPVFFHVVTKKGKGYRYAEDDPLTYHGVKPFDAVTGRFQGGAAAPKPPETFTDAFVDAFTTAAEADERVVGITAAMAEGTGLAIAEKKFPDRIYDVGICEQHAVTYSAGLATQNMRPVCAIYSTFLQRGYDQFVHDVCLQNLPVVFAVDRAGAVGEDSPTQQGAFDISFCRAIPNVRMLAPRDGMDLRAMFRWALEQDGPVVLRYARGKAPVIGPEHGRDVTRGQVLREGSDATLLAIGPVLGSCLEAAERLQREEGFSVGVADARFIKPLDADLIERLTHAPIITVEENSVCGGFGSAVLEHLEQTGKLGAVRVKRLGFSDAFIPHSTRDEQLADLGLDAAGIHAATRTFLGQELHQVV